MQHSQKAAGCLIIARGQAAKLLEATEKALDFVAVAVRILVNHPLQHMILFCWESRLAPRWRLRRPARHPYRRPCRPRRCQGPRRLPASPPRADNPLAGPDRALAAVAQGFVAGPAFFRLPAACAWARNTVESSMTQSKFGFCTASNKRCQVPFCAQRQLRLRNVSCLQSERVVPLGAAVARDPKHGDEKEPVIGAGAPHVTSFPRQVRRQGFPDSVADFVQIAHDR